MAMWRRVVIGQAAELLARGSTDNYFCITTLFPLTPRDWDGSRIADHSWPKAKCPVAVFVELLDVFAAVSDRWPNLQLLGLEGVCADYCHSTEYHCDVPAALDRFLAVRSSSAGGSHLSKVRAINWGEVAPSYEFLRRLREVFVAHHVWRFFAEHDRPGSPQRGVLRLPLREARLALECMFWPASSPRPLPGCWWREPRNISLFPPAIDYTRCKAFTGWPTSKWLAAETDRERYVWYGPEARTTRPKYLAEFEEERRRRRARS